MRTTNGAGSPAGLIAKVRIRYADGTTRDVRDRHGLEGGQDVPGGLLRSRTSTTRRWGTAAVAGGLRQRPVGPQRARRRATRPGRRRCCAREFAVTGPRPQRDAVLRRRRLRGLLAQRRARERRRPLARLHRLRRHGPVHADRPHRPAQARRATRSAWSSGRGFYGMTGGNVWRWESPPWHDEPVVRARLRIEYADGRVAGRGHRRRAGGSPTGRRSSTTSTGARPTTRAWPVAGCDTAGFDDGAWAAASEVAGPQGRARQPAPAADPGHRVAAGRRDHRAGRRTPTWSSSRACSRAGSSSPRPGPAGHDDPRAVRREAARPTGCRTSPTTAASRPASRPTASSSPARARPSAGRRASPTRASSTSRSPAGRATRRRR